MTFINVETIMVYKGAPFFTVYRSESDGSIGINFEVFDAVGNKLASVKQNRIYPHHDYAKNLTIGGTADTYILNDSSKEEFVRIIKGPKADTELDVFLKIYFPNGTRLDATPGGSSMGGLFMTGVTMKNANIGVNIT